AEQAQRAEILDARQVEVRIVPPVVDDPLRVRVGETDTRARGECVLAAHARISERTSSRFRSISSCERASRFSRSSGSVFDGRTLKCQSSPSTDTPSRCEIFASPA